MNQRKKDIMKIRIIQAYAVCKAFLDAYRNEENLKSLEEFGDVVDEISAFVDAFDNSPLFQTLKDIRQIAYEKYQHDWMISHDIDEKVMDKTMQEYIADTAGEEVPFSEWLFDHGFGGSLWACDNKDQSVYTRKSNGASIGCENDMGNVNMFLYQKTKEENENVGIQIETSRTQRIPVETRRVFNRNQGVYQNDKVQDEIEEHTENGCNPKDVKDFDGKDNTETHEHDDIEKYVEQILGYDNEDGEKSINEIFTEKEVREKLLRELKENTNKLSKEQIIENVEKKMNANAQIYTREHKREQ